MLPPRSLPHLSILKVIPCMRGVVYVTTQVAAPSINIEGHPLHERSSVCYHPGRCPSINIEGSSLTLVSACYHLGHC